MKIKTLFSSLLAILLLVGLAGAVVRYPDSVGHVNDFANLLAPDVERKLEQELRIYKEQTSIEIAVVTVKSLEGLSVEDYTIGLARKWGLGEKKKDNGVVLLVAPNERKVRIEVGYGLEPDLTDSQAGRVIRDTIVPLFKQSKIADGVVSGVAGILSELGEKPYAERLEERKNQPKSSSDGGRPLWLIVTIAIVIIVVILLVVLVVIAITTSGGYSSGGYSSGSFTWSSGGSDSGGGGGSFGGGSFGGGGASGSW